MDDREVLVGGRTVCVREAGDPDGMPVLHFHGTPGSRLDLDFGDRVAQELGVRVDWARQALLLPLLEE
jgi:hypothetical protein